MGAAIKSQKNNGFCDERLEAAPRRFRRGRQRERDSDKVKRQTKHWSIFGSKLPAPERLVASLEPLCRHNAAQGKCFVKVMPCPFEKAKRAGLRES